MAETSRDLEAHHKIDAHEKVCAERYGNLWEAVKRIEAGMVNDRTIRATADAETHVRVNTISNRFWAVMLSVCGGSIAALLTLVFFLLTRGKL